MSEETSGAISGAAQGAAAGTMIMPGIGTAVGAIVGGVFGFLGGSKKRAARLAYNKANKVARSVSYLDAAVSRRDVVRNARIERARSVAAAAASGEGGLLSSAPRGALSSIGAQTNFNLGYFDWRIGKQYQQQQYLDKAGKYAAQAENIGGLFNAAIAGVKAYKGWSAASTPSQIPKSYPPIGTETEEDKG